MRKHSSLNFPEIALARVLDALEEDLIHASDEEIQGAAGDLGMNLAMKGSAAFIGLRSPGSARLPDFFDLENLTQIRGEIKGLALVNRSGRDPTDR
jgi:hypothetical protein